MSLTAELRNRQSPLSRFLQEHFPKTEPIAAGFRMEVANAATIAPVNSLDHPYSTIGTAFDWRFRYYLSAEPWSGLRPSASEDPDWSAFLVSLDQVVRHTRPVGRRLGRFAEDLLNRHCLVLALGEQFVDSEATSVGRANALAARQAPLFTAEPRQVVAKALATVREEWLADLDALSWAAYDTLGGLFGDRSVLHPTFAGGADVGGADGDLILDDCLVEIKTTLDPRWRRAWLDQLLGYVLLDYNDRYGIRSIGVYLARQRILVRWPLVEVIATSSSGQSLHLDDLRSELREALLQQRTSLTGEASPGRPSIKRLGSPSRVTNKDFSQRNVCSSETAIQLELPFV
jgi:hypothetical protein